MTITPFILHLLDFVHSIQFSHHCRKSSRHRCTTSGVHEVTPHERYYGKKPDLLDPRMFSAIAYVHILDEKQQNLDLQVGEMYPRRILTRTEGVQMLQPIYPKSSSKSRRRLQRIRILVRTRDESDSNPDRCGIGRTRARSWRSPRKHVRR